MAKVQAISISGYKSLFKDKQISLLPLTILAGSNSGGKSSFMQPLLLIKQTLESSFDPGTLLISGEHVKFDQLSQIFSDFPDGRKSDFFSISITNDKNGKVEVIYKKGKNDSIEIDKVVLNDENFQNAELREGIATQNIIESLQSEELNNVKEMFGDKVQWKIKRHKCFLWIEAEFSNKPSILCQNILHLPGLRGNPERTYKRTFVDSHFPGLFQVYTASIIDKWKISKAGKDKIRKLGEYLTDLGLTSKVDTRKIDAAHIEILVSKLSNSSSRQKDLISIVDVGFGVSQTLPILTSLLTAKKDQIVYLEQPEIHLHPRAQLGLAQPIIDASNRGVIVVVETHSSLLLRGIQTAVAKKKIDHGKVSLNWFLRDTETGETNISSVILDENGAFGDFPEDFDDISLQAEQKYLDAVEANYEEA
jgi:predicted ATPase